MEQALLAGFPGVDTANHYRNHEGVRRGISSARRDGYKGDVWVQSKVEGCGNSVDSRSPVLRGQCYEHTLARLEDDLRNVGVEWLDLASRAPLNSAAPAPSACAYS